MLMQTGVDEWNVEFTRAAEPFATNPTTIAALSASGATATPMSSTGPPADLADVTTPIDE